MRAEAGRSEEEKPTISEKDLASPWHLRLWGGDPPGIPWSDSCQESRQGMDRCFFIQASGVGKREGQKMGSVRFLGAERGQAGLS